VQSASLRTCPSCGTELPVHEGYLTWCHRCNWNLTAPPRDTPDGPLHRLYAAAGRRLGERLARELLAARELEPRLTIVMRDGNAFAVETKSGRYRKSDTSQALRAAAWAKQKFGQRWVTAVLCVCTDPPEYPEQHGYLWVLGPEQLEAWILRHLKPPLLAPPTSH
jgi:hypothetical protein